MNHGFPPLKIKLQTRVVLSISAILLLSGVVVMVLSVGTLLKNTDKTIALNLRNLAGTVAALPVVIDGLKAPPDGGTVQKQVLNIFDSFTDVDYIVVCNMDSIRYSHPNPELVGEKIVGGDDHRIVSGNQSYTSVAMGTLGLSVRSFVPVFDYDGVTRLGFVAAGTLRTNIQNAQEQLILSYAIYLFSGLLIGIIGALLLARNIKSSLLGLEPEDLAKLYREHRGMTEALHEGVIAVDARGFVTLLNESARRLLALGDIDAEGRDISLIMPNSRLPVVVSTGEAEYDREHEVGGRVIITNRVPIVEKGKIVGAVATFRDKTMLVRLAEELTGAKQLVEALRAGSHEFKNKLHTVLGLLELGEYDRAKTFILDTRQKHFELEDQLIHVFEEPVIAGLMLGKFNYCKEQGVKISISPGSRIEAIQHGGSQLLHTLITVIGNLVDNAVESAMLNERRDGHIWVSVRQTEEDIYVEVKDNGRGFAAGDGERIFERMFSTKGCGRGTGLFLAKQELESLGGSIWAESKDGITIFTARLPLHGNMKDSSPLGKGCDER